MYEVITLGYSGTNRPMDDEVSTWLIIYKLLIAYSTVIGRNEPVYSKDEVIFSPHAASGSTSAQQPARRTPGPVEGVC